MISSKTHEIIIIPGMKDVKDFILVQAGQKRMEDVELFGELKFIQKTGDNWRLKLNYSWLICCGYIPFAPYVRTGYLPTVDKTNAGAFVFDDSIYLCPNSTVGYIFDSVIDPICPLCEQKHPGGEILLISDLWMDYPHFLSFADLTKDGALDNCLTEIISLKYDKRRIYEHKSKRKGFLRKMAEKFIWGNSKQSDEGKHLHGNIPTNRDR